MQVERTFRALAVVAETGLALLVVVGLTLLLTLPFVPLAVRAEIPLRPDGKPTIARASDEEVASRVEALGLADDVEVVLRDGVSHLVLSGDLPDDEAALQPVLQLLEQSGYQGHGLVLEPVLDLERTVLLNPGVLPVMLTVQAGIFLAAGLLLRRWRLGSPERARMDLLRAAALGIGAGLVVSLGSWAIAQLLEWVGLPVEEQDWIQKVLATPGRALLLAPWIVFIGPLSEEVFFRGYVFGLIRRHVGFPAALLVSSVMFAAIHFNLSGFLIYLLIGCVLAAAYERATTLVAPVVAHMTLNAIVLVPWPHP